MNLMFYGSVHSGNISSVSFQTRCTLFFSLFAVHVSAQRHLQEHNCIAAAKGVWMCGDYNIISWCAVFIFCVNWCFHVCSQLRVWLSHLLSMCWCVCVFVLFRCLYGFLVLRVKCAKSFVYLQFLVLFIPYEQVLVGTDMFHIILHNVLSLSLTLSLPN